MFKVKKLSEARNLIKSTFSNKRKVIEVNTIDSLGLIVAEDVRSNFDVPHFSRSTVDGYAVQHKSVNLASSTVPVLLKNIGTVEMGSDSDLVINKNTAYVPTGGYLPEGADAAVMIENTEQLGDEIIIYSSPAIYENVLLKGSDISVGDLILNKHSKVSPRTIGMLTGAGVETLKVFKPITAIVLSTGDEIVAPNKTPKIGEIRDINTYTVCKELELLGIQVLKTMVIKDNFDKYYNEVDNALKIADMVIASGGSSVGDKDYTIDVLNKMNANVLAHGLNIKPGKPTILAEVDGKFFFGLPGQPLSAYIVLIALIDSYLEAKLEVVVPRRTVTKELTLSVHAAPGRVTYQLVKIMNEFIEPIFTKSGMISGLANADGFIVIEENKEGLDKGEMVEVFTF